MVYISNPTSNVEQSTDKQLLKQQRKQVSKLARMLIWAQRIFLACVIVITSYNVALAICDTIYNNYTLWLTSTIASISFCAVCIGVILTMYFYLKNLTKQLS